MARTRTRSVSTPSYQPSSQSPVNYDKFIDNIFKSLGIENESSTIKSELLNLKNSDKIQIMESTQIQGLIKQLNDADTKINKLANGDLQNYVNSNNDKWKGMLLEFGRLQALSILKNVSKSENCDEKINKIVDAMTEKLSTVNTVLTENLNPTTNKYLSSGSEFNYFQKYLKYKNKYLLLKNNF
jgi:hypothetical protein